MKIKESEDLYTCNSVEINGNLPTEIQLLPIGEWKGYIDPETGNARTFKVTPEHIRAAVDYHKKRKEKNPGRDLVIDLEHQTLTDEEAPAAGWMDWLIERADGLYASIKFWTDLGTGHLKNKTYRYISPVFKFNAIDKVSGETIKMIVMNAALTNEPFFDELKPLVTKDTNIYQLKTKEKYMDELMKKLIGFLGMSDTATPEDVMAEMSKMMDQLKESVGSAVVATKDVMLEFIASQKQKLMTMGDSYNQVIAAVGAKENATVEEVTALIAAKGDTSQFVAKSKYDELLSQVTEKEITQLLDEALAKGKMTPATRDSMKVFATKDRKSFEEYLTKIPDYSLVPLEKINVTIEAKDTVSLSDVEKHIAKTLGLDEKKVAATV